MPIPDEESDPVTKILDRWKAGDQAALHALIPWLYEELRRAARRQLRNERPDHSFQSTALVHEVYLRLGLQKPFEAASRQHFIRVASRLMRQVLVDHSRRAGAQKRGADRILPLDTSLLLASADPTVDVVRIDDALTTLAELDERQAKIVELRFFGGLSNEEVAESLGISLSTVKREWNVARAWLGRELGGGIRDDP